VQQQNNLQEAVAYLRRRRNMVGTRFWRSYVCFVSIFAAFFCVHAAWGEVMVAPAAGIDQMIQRFDEVSMTEEKKEELKRIELKYLDMKSRGETLWKAEDWMKPENYYKGLDTEALARECFSRSTFAVEMIAFAGHEEVAFVRLKVMHNGFAELFSRSDMWKGILAVYEMLISNLDPMNDTKDVVRAALSLHSLENLYFFYPFKTQIKGHEELFLEANVGALKRFSWFIANRSNGKIPFYVEPFTVASVALMLQQQINPQNYNEIIPELSAVRFTNEQNKEDIKKYLDLAIPSLERGMHGR
jgi:hypothetical protein